MRSFLVAPIVAGLIASLVASASAEAPKKNTGKDPRLGEADTATFRIGATAVADRGPCTGVLLTLPVPAEWPEQKVLDEKLDKSRYVTRVQYKTLTGGVRQMRVMIPRLPAGAEAKAVLTVTVRRHSLLPPADPGELAVPRRLTRELRGYLAKSPCVQCTHAKIKLAAKEAVAGHEGTWQQVRAIYDWVKKHVKYEPTREVQGALYALENGKGDCDELTTLFVALCRANRIPARTVWVPGHCYPEFYLADKTGKGHWIPCEPTTNLDEFGRLLIQPPKDVVVTTWPSYSPILQKGDNFILPERPGERLHYVMPTLKVDRGLPNVKFIRERVEATKKE